MGIPDPYDKSDKELTAKERVFVFMYLQSWNYNRANEEAGFRSGAKKRFEQPHIQAAIADRMKTMSMRADEAIYRLTEQARVNPAEFYVYAPLVVLGADGKPFTDEDGQVIISTQPIGINWDMVQARGHLIKSIKYDRRGRVMLEFHDSQAALTLIGRHEKLFTDTIDINAITSVKAYVGISPDEWDTVAPVDGEDGNTE